MGVDNSPNGANEEYLTDYTKAIRKALSDCQQECLRSEGSNKADTQMLRSSEKPWDRTATNGTNISELQYQDTTPENFLRDFIQSNRPCLIRHSASSFEEISDWWSNPAKSRDWFRRHVKEPVPVRRGAPSASLDVDGRAQECETIMMTMDEWIAHLDNTEREEQLYLKDWHLQSFIEKQYPQHEPLYRVPDIFPSDLLNTFLNAFDIGDYRFVYWGPEGSSTAWHSDVMNSFSWSYNVYGAKKWEFEGGISCIQKAGDLMFVPSKLQHSVANLEETLSVNHNWVTAWNVEFVWGCMKSEIAAIDKELESWGIEAFDARENMLRGCLGLDVTSFVLMMAWSLLKSSRDGESSLLRHQLIRVLDDEAKSDVHLRQRLAATFSDSVLANEAMNIVQSITGRPLSQHVETAT